MVTAKSKFLEAVKKGRAEEAVAQLSSHERKQVIKFLKDKYTQNSKNQFKWIHKKVFIPIHKLDDKNTIKIKRLVNDKNLTKRELYTNLVKVHNYKLRPSDVYSSVNKLRKTHNVSFELFEMMKKAIGSSASYTE